MAEVTHEMILDYITKKGGVVRNVDLVRHFKKYLQVENAPEKDRARVIFKERVNKVAVIKADNKQEKYLHLRPDFYPPGGLTRPPTGRTQGGSDRASVSSQEEGPRSSLQPFTSVISEVPSLKSPEIQGVSYTRISSPPSSPATTTTPTIVSPTNHATQRATPTSSTTSSSPLDPLMTSTSGKLKGLSEDDFGSSLMAELSSFGSLLDSFGTSGKPTKSPPPSSTFTTSTNPPAPVDTSRYSSYSTGPTHGPTHGHTPAPAPQNRYSTSSNYATPQGSGHSTPQRTTNSSSPQRSANSTPLKTNYSSSPQGSANSTPLRTNYSSSPQGSANTSSPQGSANSTPLRTNYSSSPQGSANTSSPQGSANSTPLRTNYSSSPQGSANSTPLRTNYSSSPQGSANTSSPQGSANSTPLRMNYSSSPQGSANSTPLRTNNSSSSLESANSTPLRTNYSQGSANSTPQRSENSTPQRTAYPAPQKTNYSSPYNSANSTPQKTPEKKKGGRDMDLDLTDVLFSLPSAKPAMKTTPRDNKQPQAQQKTSYGQPQTSSSYGQPQSSSSYGQPQSSSSYGQPQTSSSYGQPQSSSSYGQPQSSSSYGQPQSSSSYGQPQSSSSYGQPQSSSSYGQPQSSSSYGQPQSSSSYGQPQPKYQNSTRFDQPKMPPPGSVQNGRYEQPSISKQPKTFQNSTRFDQPKPNQPAQQVIPKPDPPKATPSYQGQPSAYMEPVRQERGSSAVQPSAPTPYMEPVRQERGSSAVQPSQQNTGRRSAPQAPVRSSSISRGSRDSQDLSFGSSRSGTQRAAPPPPLQTTPLTTNPASSQSTNSPFQSSLGTFDLGDLASSMFSSTAPLSTNAAPSSSTHSNNPAPLSSTHSNNPVPSSSTHSNNPAPSSSTHSNNPAPSSSVQSNSIAPSSSTHSNRPPLDSGYLSGLAPSVSSNGYSHKLGPSVSLPPSGPKGSGRVDRRQVSGDSTGRRQGSTDSSFTPSIKIESPIGNGSGSPSRRGKSPPYSSGEMRGHSSIGSGLGVQLRNKEGKVGRGISAVVRRSKNMDKSTALDSFTRLSISMTPPSSRKHRPPDVAPKPIRNSSPSPSHEDVQQQQQYEGDEDVHSEYDYDEIDPLEKEWMLASAQADIDGLQRLMMTDSSLLNRKGFLHGYTALHWAAKHGRMDILSMLLLQGATTNIKSTGLTPLHLAAQAGHDSVLEILITQHNADISLRENGGRRAIDLLNNKSSDKTKRLLSHLHNHGLPVRVETCLMPATFSRSRDQRSSLDRNWKSLGELAHMNASDKDKSSKKRLSPRSAIRKSFSFKKSQRVRLGTNNVLASPKHRKDSRPMSDHKS